MENVEIANIFYQIGDILEIQGANKYRIGAYRKAAQSIETFPSDINEIYKKGGLKELEKIPGVGKSIALKIEEMIKTGKLKELKQLQKKVPPSVSEMMQVEGIGPKLVKLVYKRFKVKNIKQLEKLCKEHRLSKLKGFKEKTEENILRGIELYRKFGERKPLGKVHPQAEAIIKKLKASGLCEQVEIAGSLRRMKETIGDIDILVTSKYPKKVMDLFCSLEQVRDIEAKGKTKSTVILKTGIEADLRVVDPKSFGAALYYFTGSKQHNIHTRRIAVEKGLKINEYGVFRVKTNKRIAGKTEKEVLKTIGLPFIPPELREDRGEVEKALAGKLPRLIELKDIQGDLQMHTKFSDGNATFEDMAKKGKELGYKYIAITDHASPLGILKGRKPKEFIQYIKRIRQADKKIKGITILAGVEVDIYPDGKLYLPDSVLKRFDLVLAAVHSKFRQSESDMTRRIIKAIKNPYVHILAHPTGRIIGERQAYAVNLDKVMEVAKKTGTILELNAFWSRLDLNDVNCKKAKERGIKIVISTDAHDPMELEVMRYGVATARRGWLEKKDVINTLPLEKLKKMLK